MAGNQKHLDRQSCLLGVCNVTITFTEDGITQMISMVQPWGEEGIWIPQTYEKTDIKNNHSFGDIDGNGQEEYLTISDIENNDPYVGHLEFYFNGDMIYEYDNILRMDGGEAHYIDLDQDGKEEIFFTFYPYVNSMPLVEYAVLKNTGSTWETLEMLHGETSELDNSFPITCVYGNKKNLIQISCQGYDDVITYDITSIYEKLKSDMDSENYLYQYYDDVLNGINYKNGNKYKEGDIFGNILPWGIWEITADNHNGTACLVASHGLGGSQGKYDYLGRVNIFFHYTSSGKIQILNMEFIAESSDIK